MSSPVYAVFGINKAIASALTGVLGDITTAIIHALESLLGWIMTQIALWIGSMESHIFIAELGLVTSVARDTSNLQVGARFSNLLAFNAVIIPGLAAVAFLVWLIIHAITGGNSKTSTEEMLKRVVGAMAISMVLSLVIPYAEQLVGALDGALMSVVHLNGAGLGTAFSVWDKMMLLSGPPGGALLFVLIVLLLGLMLAGLLILMLILAHAVAFLLIYFAPYMTLFRKEGFRESVEGVTASIAMPFIIVSILAVGVSTFGSIGTLHTPGVSALGHVAYLSAMVGGHAFRLPMRLASSTTPTAGSSLPSLFTPINPSSIAHVSMTTYILSAFSGMLILGSAI